MITLPIGCPRERGDCEALARTSSDDGRTFVCIGRNDGASRRHPQDVLTKCVRSVDVDTIEHVDELDLLDEASVALQALAIFARVRA